MKTDIFPRNFLSPNVSSRSFLLPKSVFSPGLVSTVTCHQDPSPFITSHRSKVQPDTVNYHLTPYFCPSPVTSRLPPTLVYDTSCVSFLPPWDTPVVLNFRSQFIPPFILTPSLICFVSKDLRVQSWNFPGLLNRNPTPFSTPWVVVRQWLRDPFSRPRDRVPWLRPNTSLPLPLSPNTPGEKCLGTVLSLPLPSYSLIELLRSQSLWGRENVFLTIPKLTKTSNNYIYFVSLLD